MGPLVWNNAPWVENNRAIDTETMRSNMKAYRPGDTLASYQFVSGAPKMNTSDDTMMKSEMPYRELGRTGEKVSAIGIGGSHLASEKVEEKLAIRIVRSAIDWGICSTKIPV
jgi:hypothetical protein